MSAEQLSSQQIAALIGRLWNTSQIAGYLGVSVGTVASYRGRNQIPAPIGYLGRTPVWDAHGIKTWAASRPRKPVGEK